MDRSLTTVTIGLSSVDDSKRRLADAFKGEEQGAYISFDSIDLLWKVITPRRWDLLRTMAGAGPLAVRELARRAGRDLKSVHGDTQALLKAGVIDRTEDGRIVLPYDQVHVDFILRAA